MTHLDGSVFSKKSVGLIIGLLLVSNSQTGYLFLIIIFNLSFKLPIYLIDTVHSSPETKY